LFSSRILVFLEYESVYNRVDTQSEIAPYLPIQKGVPRFAGFGNEGLGEISEE
jgi:hypothetical protein